MDRLVFDENFFFVSWMLAAVPHKLQILIIIEINKKRCVMQSSSSTPLFATLLLRTVFMFALTADNCLFCSVRRTKKA